MELRQTVLPGRQIGRAEVQPLRLTVLHLPHLPAHDGGEYKVGSVQYLLPGTEILAEEDSARLPLLRLRRIWIPAVLLQKDGGVRQAEAVDGLFYIAYGEKAASAAGKSIKDAVLHLIGILVLIHHHLQVTL